MESPEVIAKLKHMAECLATMADECAEKWKDVPGDVALRMFAEAIRRTNEGTKNFEPKPH